jgi:hypothetical protein
MYGSPRGQLPTMGFLLLSKAYPTLEIRESFFQTTAGIPDFMITTRFLYEPLPASATTEEWRMVVHRIEKNGSKDYLDNEKNDRGEQYRRPLKPNDDNYAAFIGPQWKVSTSATTFKNTDDSAMLHPSLAQIRQRLQHDPTPHYECCAQCTKSNATQQCSKCRIVKYCDRTCQKQHWKAVHRTSCEHARPCTLRQALKTNEGFYVTPDECRIIAQVLKRDTSQATNKQIQESSDSSTAVLIRIFASYFDHVSNLEGCFVL